MKNLSFFILVFFLSFLSPAFAAYDNLYLVGMLRRQGGIRMPLSRWKSRSLVSLRGQELYRIIV